LVSVPPILYTSIPSGTVPVNGDTSPKSLSATLGGRNPFVVVSSSSNELALMVPGLLPILTWDFAIPEISNK